MENVKKDETLGCLRVSSLQPPRVQIGPVAICCMLCPLSLIPFTVISQAVLSYKAMKGQKKKLKIKKNLSLYHWETKTKTWYFCCFTSMLKGRLIIFCYNHLTANGPWIYWPHLCTECVWGGYYYKCWILHTISRMLYLVVALFADNLYVMHWSSLPVTL